MRKLSEYEVKEMTIAELADALAMAARRHNGAYSKTIDADNYTLCVAEYTRRAHALTYYPGYSFARRHYGL